MLNSQNWDKKNYIKEIYISAWLQGSNQLKCLPGLRIQKTVMSDSIKYSISSRKYKSTIIIPKAQT